MTSFFDRNYELTHRKRHKSLKKFMLPLSYNNGMMRTMTRVSGSLLSCVSFDIVALYCRILMADFEEEDVPEGTENK